LSGIPVLLAPDFGDLSVDLLHGEPVRTPAPGRGLHSFEPLGRGRHGVDVILDAHDDDTGFAAAVHHKAFIILGRPPEDLPEDRRGEPSVVIMSI
jgi:hypothetical protein